MNDDQLDKCFQNLKSSVNVPVTIDTRLEERVMELTTCLKNRRTRTRRLVATIALLFVAGTGFVAMGGDSAVINYISPSAELDEQGNPIPYDANWGKWLRSFHDHVWEHFRMHHNSHGSASKS